MEMLTRAQSIRTDKLPVVNSSRTERHTQCQKSRWPNWGATCTLRGIWICVNKKGVTLGRGFG